MTSFKQCWCQNLCHFSTDLEQETILPVAVQWNKTSQQVRQRSVACLLLVVWWFVVSWMTVDAGLSDMGRACLIYRGILIARQCLIVYVWFIACLREAFWFIVHDRVFDWWREFDSVCLICYRVFDSVWLVKDVCSIERFGGEVLRRKLQRK